MDLIRSTSPRPLSRRLRPLAYGLVAVIGLILMLTWGTTQVQVTLAGFLNGESVWSKAQKQAVVDLLGYAETGDAARLAAFHGNYALLRSDGWARDAIASGHYDRAQIHQAFQRGKILPQAEPGMIFMLRYCIGAPHMREAVALWRQADGPLLQLHGVATELAEAYARGQPEHAWLQWQMDRINGLNHELEPLTNGFSLEVAQGATWLGRVLFAAVFLSAFVASLLWMRTARRILLRIRGTEERYSVLFNSAADAILMIEEESGRILDANRTALQWTGRDVDHLAGEQLSSFFIPLLHRADGAVTGELRGPDDELRPVEMRSSVTHWGTQSVRQSIMRDITERVNLEQQRRIASEALASIAEGVIIAEADRRVTRVNAAHIRMTGFTVQALQGLKFDDLRCLPDGTSLPDSVWEIIEAEGNWVGEVRSRRMDGSSYPELLSISAIRSPDGEVQHYVAVINNISAAKANEQRLQYMAAHDTLTGLANRAEFERRCVQAVNAADRDRGMAAVVFIDLDAFKAVNDSYTHAIGDQLLVKVAERIAYELGDKGVAGRIGGDEFTVLLPNLHSREQASALAGRLLTVLAAPFGVGDYELALSASIGIACFPLDGTDVPTLITNADAAMYAAKTEERNAFRFYSPRMQADARRRIALASELRKALAENEFRLVYQPTIEMRTGRIVAVEALLRWFHPQRGLISPGEFIPMAEKLGLIRRIDQWVLQAACEQMYAWDQAGLPPLRMAVNVSANWFGQANFVDEIRMLLQARRLAPERLMLEITEGAILRLGEEMERTLHALHALGVSVAIDDFGTGYSSMSYLKLRAIDYLKIDQSFVAGLPDDGSDGAIVEAMLTLCRRLDISPIAEGIETEDQHRFLLRAGCVEGQGFLYSRPVEPAVIAQLLNAGRRQGSSHLRLVPPEAS
ncbi:putative bifunctional diguanylate cyclase/phosphodiesterase [Dyella japonica]|uniref:Diguanylate cyclase n=1 Tax=Dyella japonica A8 TaxID=1217721 RepID=A0A075K4A1_9GAMM|nr:EAL domain-containing protein [Dyella japonica]AIF48522.1 diguanylate cyclase [Dyella japonica A8]